MPSEAHETGAAHGAAGGGPSPHPGRRAGAGGPAPDAPPTVAVSVVGASGYTGSELVRLLSGHPGVRLVGVHAHSRAGQPLDDVLPALRGLVRLPLRSFDPEAADGEAAVEGEVAFLALPHGASARAAARLRERGLRVIDLSADFRLRDPSVYEQWYRPHEAPEHLDGAVYGLVELYRADLATADLVAVPGCYPTATLLALAPLLAEGLVEPDGIIIDAKSGVSGAGRTPKESTHFPHVAEGLRAYAVGGRHRHTPEIEQEASRLAGRPVRVLFTPHLVPMNRGILAAVYAIARPGTDALRCTEAAEARYAGASLVEVLPPGTSPDTLWVRGSARAMLSYSVCERTGRVLALCAIDNLLKGAAAQAVQAFNVRHGFPETLGLPLAAPWP